MDISAILQSLKKQAKEGYTTLYNQQEMLDSSRVDMNKHEQGKNKTVFWLIPMQLQFPFNPIDPVDDSFGPQKPYIVEGSAEDFVKTLKEYLNKEENAELKEKYMKLGNLKEYDTSDSSVITPDDIAIFAKFRRVNSLSKLTQKITTTAAGQFGVERVSPIELDDEYQIKPESEGLILTQVLRFEQDVRREKLAKFKIENPDQSKLTEDLKDTRTQIKRSAKLSYPKLSAVMLVYEFPCDTDEECLKDLSSKDLNDYLTYLNSGTETLKKIQKKVGKKADKHLDYLPVLVTYGDGKGEGTLELNLYKSREYEVKDPTSEDYNLVEKFDDFEEKIHEIIDKGFQGEYEKAVGNGIYKFSHFSDAEVLGYFTNRVVECCEYISRPVFRNNAAILEKINIEFFKELSEADKKGELPNSYSEMLLKGITEQNGTITTATLDELDDEDRKDAASMDKQDDILGVESGQEIEAMAQGN